MYYLLIANVMVIAFFLAAAIVYIRKNKKSLKQKDNTISVNYKIINDLSEQLNYLTKRVVELEDGIEHAYGINVRQVVTNIVTDFKKLEMVVLISGISKLLKGTANADDAEFYIKLTRKLQRYVDNMKEEPLKEKEL